MSSRIAIDVHTHILSEEAMRRLGRESPRVAPRLKDENGALIMEIAGKVVQRLGRGRCAHGLHPGASARRHRAGRPAEVLLHAQLRRPAIRDDGCGRGAGVRRRAGALSRHHVLPLSRRRFRALPGRAVPTRLGSARRAQGAAEGHGAGDSMDRLVVRIERVENADRAAPLADEVAQRVRAAVSLRPEVEFVPHGALYDHERTIKARRVVDLRTVSE